MLDEALFKHLFRVPRRNNFREGAEELLFCYLGPFGPAAFPLFVREVAQVRNRRGGEGWLAVGHGDRVEHVVDGHQPPVNQLMELIDVGLKRCRQRGCLSRRRLQVSAERSRPGTAGHRLQERAR